MKKSLFRLFFTVSLIVLFQKNFAQCSLDQVGAPNYSTTSQYSDMTVAPNGVVYVFSYNSGVNKMYLHSAVTSGSWTPVATISASTTVKPALSISKSGKIYVAIKDEAAGQVGKLYYLSGATFIQVGTAFSGSNKVSDLSIAFNSLGEEYVAYTDVTNGNMSTVKKWNGSAWVLVGPGPVSAGTAYYNSLIIDKTDSPVLVYQDFSAGNKATIMRFNGSSWSQIGSVGTSIVSNTKLKLVSNGNYCLGYTESGSAIVQIYNGSTWNQLGSAVTNVSTSANSFNLALDPNDQPTFNVILGTPPYPVAYKYVGVPTWSTVIGGYLNSNTSVNTGIGFDATGNPYYFYVDQVNNYGLNVKTMSSPISISSQPISVTRCNGQSGSFNVGTSGGTPAYQWQTLGTGSYTNSSAPYTNVNTNSLSFTANSSMNQNQVRCVVDVGCKNIISNTATLTVSTLTSTNTFTNPTCFNTGDGAINVIVGGGVSPYSYTWSPLGGNTANATGLYWNTYTLTANDINGCSITNTFTLTSPPSISTSFSGNMNICSGSNTSLTITATGGTPGYTYSWTPSGSLSSSTSSIVTASPGTTQTYNVTVTDAIGCTATNTVMVNVNTTPSLTISASSNTICLGNSSNLTVSGADTYLWMPGGMTIASPVVSPTTTTIYTVTGTNTLTSCSSTSTITVTVNPLPSVSAGPSRTLTCANTTTTLAGSSIGGITYSWTGPGIVSGSTTLNPTINAAGNYDLTVTSAQGCVAGPSPVTVFQDITPPTPTASSGGMLTCFTTTIALNGGPSTGVTYQWSGPAFSGGTTSQNAIATAAGVYTLLVTNSSNGCTNTATTSVSQNTIAPSPTAATSGTLTCSTLTVSLSGNPSTGVSYLWTGPGVTGSPTTQNTSANAAGSYTLKVTSSINGCTNTAVTAVIQNTTAPTVSSSVTNTLTCINTTVNAIATTTASPVTYNWTGTGIISGATTSTITTNTAGVKNYTVTNTVNGCSTSGTVSVSQNTTTPTPTASNSGTLTCNFTTVNLTGTGGGTYLWSGPGIVSGGATANPVINLPGCYNLTVTSANGCSATATSCVTQNTISPSVTGNVSSTLTCSNATANVSANTVASPVSYNWTGAGIIAGAGTGTITVNAPGIKNYTVTNNSNGCLTTGTLSVLQNTTTPLGLSAGPAQTITCASPSVTLNGTISAPGNALFNWTGGVCGSTTNSITSACAPAIYTLTATDPFNGCTSSSTVQVFANAGVPNISSSSSGTLTCVNINVNAIASTTVSNVDYLWTGPGIVSGATSATATVNQPGNFSVTVTNTLSGCSANSTVIIIQDISVPTLTLSSSPSTICAGNSSTLSANGSTNVNYSWLPGSLNGATQAVSPSSSTQYTATATNTINGCVTSETIALVVNPLPNLTISGNTSICKGSSTSLFVTGATSYTWNSGANTSSISVSPTVTTSYSVSGEDANGCIGSSFTSVNIISSKNISGVITSTAGSTTGDVTLYKYTPGLSMWDSVTTVPFSTSYSFSNIDSALYVVRAVPSATNIQVTYGDSAITWQNATVINHGCANNSTQNIKLIALATFTMGPGVLTGTITEAQGFGHRMSSEFKPLVPGGPIGGIVVKGGKNPGGQMFVQTLTDASGQYTLTGLPLNTGNESYFIFVDIPGLDTNGTYHIVISSGNTQFSGLNFTVDSIYINPIGNITKINSDDLLKENNVYVYPNPSKDLVSIKYELTESANVGINLYNIMGEKIQEILPTEHQVNDKYTYSFNLKNYSCGVYFLKYTVNGHENYIKLIKSQ